MTPQIRPATRADIPHIRALVNQAFPSWVLTEDYMLWRFDNPLPEFDDLRLVALEGDTVIGSIMGRLRTDENDTKHGRSFLGTAPNQNEDLPARLLEAAESTLIEKGATVLRAAAAEESVQVGGERFREAILARGYELVESDHILGLDLEQLPEPPQAPKGVELRPWTEFADDPRPLYEIDKAADQDEPSADPEGFMSYESWLEAVWNNPMADLNLSLVLLLNGTPVAITCYKSDGATRMESAMTGTLREYRNRGLAGYAKLTALHRARQQGFTHSYTGNHETNKPMLAINNRIGYSLVGTESTYVKRV